MKSVWRFPIRRGNTTAASGLRRKNSGKIDMVHVDGDDETAGSNNRNDRQVPVACLLVRFLRFTATSVCPNLLLLEWRLALPDFCT
jgi:hypothetical protein